MSCGVVYLSFSSSLFPAQFFCSGLLHWLGFLLRGGRNGRLKFSFCSSLLGQQLWVDVGQDSTCCNGHTFQQLRRDDKVDNLKSHDAALVRNLSKCVLNARDNNYINSTHFGGK